MGAYDNPAMIVDRQSGQYVNQALRDIGNTFNAYGKIMGQRRIAKQEKDDQKAEQNNLIRKNSILEAAKLKSTALFNINKANPVKIETLKDDVDLMFNRYGQSLNRFNASQFNDGYAGSEQERVDILNISATQSFSTNAESLFKTNGELMTEYNKLFKNYGRPGGINPRDLDPMFQILMTTQGGSYPDGTVSWGSTLNEETQTVDFSYNVTGKAVQKQNAINWYNSLTPELKEKLGLGEPGPNPVVDVDSIIINAEEFADVYSGVGMNPSDIDLPQSIFDSGLAIDNGQGGFTFSNESSFSMDRLKSIVDDVDGNPYNYGGLFSVIPNTLEDLSTSADESKVTIQGKMNPKFYENQPQEKKKYYKGNTQYESTVTIPNLDELDIWVENSATSQVNQFEEMEGGVGNVNAIIRQHAKPVLEDGKYQYDADGNQIYAYKQFKEAPSEANDYMWSEAEWINISVLDDEDVYNSGGGTGIWKKEYKEPTLEFFKELSRRQGDYYAVPVQSEKPTGKVRTPRGNNNTPSLPPQYYQDLASDIMNNNTVNWNDGESVVEFFNNKRLDKTKAKTGSGAIQDIDLQIKKYMEDGEPSRSLNKTQKNELANLQSQRQQLKPNGVYIKWGGTGKYEPIQIGSAGTLANAVRAAFSGDAEQKNFDNAYAQALNAKTKAFTFDDWYKKNFDTEPSEMDRNNPTSIASYKEALKELEKELKR